MCKHITAAATTAARRRTITAEEAGAQLRSLEEGGGSVKIVLSSGESGVSRREGKVAAKE